MSEETHNIKGKSIQDTVRDIQNALDQYIESDTLWKSDNQVALDNMKNLTISWKIFLSFCTGIAAIGGAIFIIWKLIRI